MFTGIVSDIGTLIDIKTLQGGKCFTIRSGYKNSDIQLGASIAHNGVCLTVVEKSEKTSDPWYRVEVWEEALRLTTLGEWSINQKINLERALKIGEELGGHLVSGHVDGTARITGMKWEGEALRHTLCAPDNLAKFIAPKGSIALDGVSLTINGIDGNLFDVLLIRHTLEVTCWKTMRTGNSVNLEVDQMARYADHLSLYR